MLGHSEVGLTPRVGHGYDSHRFDEGRPLVLGGVRIPDHAGLAGHSDGDAVAHAVIDAILWVLQAPGPLAVIAVIVEVLVRPIRFSPYQRWSPATEGVAVTPFGVLVLLTGALTLIFGPGGGSDFWVDALRAWW